MLDLPVTGHSGRYNCCSVFSLEPQLLFTTTVPARPLAQARKPKRKQKGDVYQPGWRSAAAFFCVKACEANDRFP
eukprot:40559-Eustigmatos_ZCMA.PRE.2